MSTSAAGVKYTIFQRDPRAQLLVEDSTGFRAVLVPATVQIREDIATELAAFARSGTSTAGPYPAMSSICWP